MMYHSTQQMDSDLEVLAGSMTGKCQVAKDVQTTVATYTTLDERPSDHVEELDIDSGNEAEIEDGDERVNIKSTGQAKLRAEVAGAESARIAKENASEPQAHDTNSGDEADIEDCDERVNVGSTARFRARLHAQVAEAERDRTATDNSLEPQVGSRARSPDSDVESDTSTRSSEYGRVYRDPPYSDTESEGEWDLKYDIACDAEVSRRTERLALAKEEEAAMLFTEDSVSNTQSDPDVDPEMAKAAEEACKYALLNKTSFPKLNIEKEDHDSALELELYNAAINAVANSRGPSSETDLRSPWWQLKMSIHTMSLGKSAPWLAGRVENETRVSKTVLEGLGVAAGDTTSNSRKRLLRWQGYTPTGLAYVTNSGSE